jgi:DHA1 family tetracycline resistance protein-like MFS transporter
MAQQNTSTHTTNYVHFLGQKRVFIASLLLTLMDLAYIYFILPESIGRQGPFFKGNEHEVDNDDDDDFSSTSSSASSSQWDHLRREVLPYAWRPMDTLKIFTGDPLMYQVGIVALLYYTSMWAVVSTLMIYAAKRFSLGPERLGELISILGLCTMISEAVLVRLVVPALGEKTSIRVGLAAFTIQCVVLALAYEGWQLFFCVLLSMAVNLVYPSLTSMVTSFVAPQMVGTALGAMNGVKAFTGRV